MARTSAETVSVAQFAKDWNRSPRTVRTWLAGGMPARSENGHRKIVRAEANEWLLEQTEARARAAAAPPDEQAERTRWIRAKRRRAELELARVRRTLVAVDDVVDVFEAHVRSMRYILLAWPSRTAHQAVGLETLAQATAVLDDLVRALMTELSEMEIGPLRLGPEPNVKGTGDDGNA